jgi:uncharacterized protein YndB with AHSA1/START domain
VGTVDRFIAAPPSEVFSVLADGWPVSRHRSHVRRTDDPVAIRPAVGSKLHHASGVWPLALRDESVVDAVDPEKRLELTVKGRPFGEAKVVMTLTAEDDGTRVSMYEAPTKGPGKWLHNQATEALLIRRNVEALARLGAIAERHTSPPS